MKMIFEIFDDRLYSNYSNDLKKSSGEKIQLNINKVLGYLVESFDIKFLVIL